jgi:Fe-S cluster assembly scaffold protein SufB
VPGGEVVAGNLSREGKSIIERVGIEADGLDRSTVIIENKKSLCDYSIQEGVEVKNIKRALDENGGLKDYWWKLIEKDKDEFTKRVEKGLHQGYFVRIKKGIKAQNLVQTCLYISKPGLSQRVHNIIVAEEGSDVTIVTGCLVGDKIARAEHLGITEIFVGKGARVSFNMIHHWGKEVKVWPRTAVEVSGGGVFESNYVCLKPVKYFQSNPICRLKGRNSRAYFNSYVLAHPGSFIDIGSSVIADGSGAKAEVVSRIVSSGGVVINRGLMVGNAKGVKTHLDCGGLILSDGGKIKAIPEIEANLPDLEMTHEAAVGKVSKEAVEYLMSRGIREKEAISLIVRGFWQEAARVLPQAVALEVERFTF